MKKRLNIYVSGYYGKGNFGDELFLMTFKQLFTEHHLFGLAKYIDFKQVDAIIIGGGDIIAPYRFNNNYFQPDFLTKPRWIYGVGVVSAYQAVKGEVMLYQQYTQGAQGFVVRDIYSHKLAQQLQLHPRVELAPDIVFSYQEPNYPIKFVTNKKTIGVVLHAYDQSPVEIIINLATLIDPKNYELVLLPVVNQAGHPFADFKQVTYLKEKLSAYFPKLEVTIFKEYNMDQLYAVLQALSLLISFKLHPTLAAIRGNVPVFCFSEQKKVAALLESFGLAEYLLPTTVDYTLMQDKFSCFLQETHKTLNFNREKLTETITASNQALLNLKKAIESYAYET
ncbi:MAG: hypothetical protein RLZ12_1024 [Bacillota bacterium]|jgi:polysaccharide pyruvyl transferase WcaK-like protein